MISEARAAFLTFQSGPEAEFWNVDGYRRNHCWGTVRCVGFGSSTVPAAYHRTLHQRRRRNATATAESRHASRSIPPCRPATSRHAGDAGRSEEHTSELQSLMRISYAVFCLKKKTITTSNIIKSTTQ